MLIIYRKSDGMIASNSGTNSARPRGPSISTEVQNAINAHGGEPGDYGAFRLHDRDDAATVQAILGAESYELEFNQEGRATGVTNIVPRPEPDPPPPEPDTTGFLDNLIGYFGLDEAEALMGKYPTFVRSIDGLRWDLAQNRMQKMLSAGDVTQQQYDDVQGMWDQFNLPRPE